MGRALVYPALKALAGGAMELAPAAAHADAAGDDDQAHAKGPDAHHRQMAQYVHHAAQRGRAATDDQVRDKDNGENENEAVIAQRLGQGLS